MLVLIRKLCSPILAALASKLLTVPIFQPTASSAQVCGGIHLPEIAEASALVSLLDLLFLSQSCLAQTFLSWAIIGSLAIKSLRMLPVAIRSIHAVILYYRDCGHIIRHP